MKVRDIMSTHVQCATSATPLVEVANLMAQNDFGCVPVCDQDKLIGMVTDRDIVVRAVAQGKNPTAVKAGEIMSKSPYTIAPDSDIHEASALMAKEQIRRLPVLENNKLVGMVALGDMAVENIHVNEAGDALSDISQGVHH